MKRFSFAMMSLALAGLVMMVSCRKPVIGFSGDGRVVTVSAVTESGNGSKTSIDGLNVKWSAGDQIRMNAESVLTLTEGAGTTKGVFKGTVTCDGPYYIGYPADATTYEGTTLKLNIPAEMEYNEEKQTVPMVAYAENADDGLQFRNAVNVLKLQLKGKGTTASKLTSIVLTSTESNLSGDINVTFDGGGNPTFAAIAGDEAGKTMTVSFGDGLQLTTDATTEVYIPLAKISVGGDLTVRFNCANGEYMEKKVTVTADFDGVNNMLSAPELTVEAKPKFSVSAETKVEFAPGNLYYNGEDKDSKRNEALPSGWNFYEHQWDYNTSTLDKMEISLFTWGYGSWSTGYNESYCTGETMTDWGTLAIGSDPANTWRTLTADEWNYLLGRVKSSCRDDASCLYALVTLTDVNVKGLVILPDDSEANAANLTTTDLVTEHGAVFLPAAGDRIGTTMYDSGRGYYWSSTHGTESVYAYYLDFPYSNSIAVNQDKRSYGRSVRLVR